MRGRVAKAFGAACAVVAGLSPVAGAAHYPAVAGETVVRVQGAAKMRISLPRRAAVAVDTAKSVRVDGGGRLVGLVLRENHPQGEELSVLRLPAQLGSKVYAWGPSAPPKGCEAPLPVHTDCSKATFPAHYDLRRGTYTLYAFTDGAPATVTLRFANYSGSTVLDPRTPVEAGSRTFATSPAAPVSWSGGAAVTTEGVASLFTVAWWKQDESVAAQAGSCWYDDAAPAHWLPGCPGGSSASGGEVATPVTGAWGPARGGQRGLLGTSSRVAPGTYGVGAWAVAQNVRDAAGFAYWLGR